MIIIVNCFRGDIIFSFDTYIWDQLEYWQLSETEAYEKRKKKSFNNFIKIFIQFTAENIISFTKYVNFIDPNFVIFRLWKFKTSWWQRRKSLPQRHASQHRSKASNWKLLDVIYQVKGSSSGRISNSVQRRKFQALPRLKTKSRRWNWKHNANGILIESTKGKLGKLPELLIIYSCCFVLSLNRKIILILL